MNTIQIRFIKTVVILAIMLAVILNPTAAKAIDFSGLTIEPAFQLIDLLPAETATQSSVKITNHSTQPVNLEFFAYDFKTVDTLGSLALIDGLTEGYPHTLTPFLHFGIDRVALPPGETQSIPFTIDNRSILSPGGHYAAIIARAQLPEDTAQSQIVPGLASLVLVRKVGGEQFHLSLSDVAWSPQTFAWRIPKRIELTFTNEGNVHLKPRGILEITDMFNRLVAKAIINEDSHIVLPGTVRKITVQIQKASQFLPINFLSMKINGSTDLGDISYSAETSFIYIHPLVLIGIVCFLTWIFWKRKNRTEKNHAHETNTTAKKN